MNTKPIVLCFSGHDATGGAGIQADIETIGSLGAHACTVVTALTAQDTDQVKSVYPVDLETIQLVTKTLLDDITPHVIKIGLMGSIDALKVIIQTIKSYPNIPVVLDPVFASGSGSSSFAKQSLIDSIAKELLPLCTLSTPNTYELLQLAQVFDATISSQEKAAICLNEQGCDYILATGTHAQSEQVHNELYFNQRLLDVFSTPRLDKEYHGSGCTLASATAALLAFGLEPMMACKEAVDFTVTSLESGVEIGSGQTIPNRLAWAQQ